MQFHKVGLIGKFGEQNIENTLTELQNILQNIGASLVSDERTSTRYPKLNLQSRSPKQMGQSCDLIIVVGGDGTFLQAARLIAPWHKIMLGINLGRLGFLTDITPDDSMGNNLKRIFDGYFKLENRCLLSCQIIRDGQVVDTYAALNDVIVHKWEAARMIEYETRIDGYFVNIQRSDGTIISTPTGSTAYALSGGGPILEPSVDAFCVVPICPHTLSSRPIVIKSSSVIEIEMKGVDDNKSQVTCDGQTVENLSVGDVVRIQKSTDSIRLIHPDDYEPFGIWRKKLHWGNAQY